MTLPQYGWLDTTDMMTDYVSDTGWADLIADLLTRVDQLLKDTPTKLCLLQIKEKMGSLRFYHRLVNAEPPVAAAITEAVHEAYDRSRQTCFKCGRPGSMRNLLGWHVPTCDDHASHDAFD